MRIARMPAALSASEGEGPYRHRAFRWLLEREVDVSGRKVVDLGAGPCNFARVAEQFGARVTAVDARNKRVPEEIRRNEVDETGGRWKVPATRHLRRLLRRWIGGESPKAQEESEPEKSSIRFVRKDVRQFDVESFDVVLILGLLYHLELEDQIRVLRSCRGKTVLIDTMVCGPDLITRYPQDAWQTAVTSKGEFEGIDYPENDNVMASVGNRTSFWHTDPSYARLFAHCGFDEVTAYRPFYLAKHGLRSFYRLGPD